MCSADREWLLWVSHFTHTHFPSGFHLRGLIGAEEVTYFSDLWLCESAHSFLNLHITGIHSRCTCLHVTDEACMQECATRGRDKLDWRCREDNDSLVVGSFPHKELDGENKRPLRRREKNIKAVNSLGKCQKEAGSPLQMRALCLSNELNTMQPSGRHSSCEKNSANREKETRESRSETMSFSFIYI